MIGQTLAHYQIIERLGAGGMSEVYVARDTRLNRKVALKRLADATADDDTLLQRLDREAHAIAALSHPNIVTIYSVEESDGTRFLTMELVEGTTLGEVIPRGGLAMNDARHLAVEISAALAAAHERGIVHRDLKPANIMVNREGHVKVLDFGLAKLRDSCDALAATRSTDNPVTQAGTVLGTIPYMSPEQLMARPASPRSDVFSLGVVLFEMCTGSRPFQGESSAELISSILRDPPLSIRDLNRQASPRMARIIHRCLAKNPDDRYRDAAELRRELEAPEQQQEEGPLPRGPEASIAVLSFTDMSQDKDQQYFCDGLAEELISALARIKNLRVAARTSALASSGSGLDLREIGERLSVETILEGSVRKAGNRLRITAKLINVEDGYQLWSAQYDRDMSDIFEIQDDIARQIVKSLEIALSPEERSTLANPGTKDAEAYDYYLRGRRLFYQHRQKSIELAQQMFLQAIERDASFALAYAGIAECCYFLYSYYDGGTTCLEQADQASRKAIELGPGLAEAHASRGGVLSLYGKHAEAETEFETAIHLGPQPFDAYYLYARDSFAQGHLEKAAMLYGRAAEVDPDDYQSPLLVAQVYDDLGREAQAEAARRRGVELIKKRLVTHPDDVRALYLGANGLAVLGQIDQALEWVRLALSIEPNDSFVLYNVACVYSLAGEPEEAIQFLEQTVASGLTKRRWLDRDSQLDSIRDHPRFQALLARLE